jgi:dTDP-4-dehydrorhamnose 3,5-epimerase
MKNKSTTLQGVMILENFVSHDKRGTFVKTFHANTFQENNLASAFRESYYSTSHKDVIRGMHFQLPPHDHDKLVYVVQGEILDVVVDLRKDSPSYLQHVALRLEEGGNSIYVPRGCAHGFLTLSDTATVVYNVTSEYEPTADSGIKWDSIGFEWPILSPIISERDEQFPKLRDIISCF